MKHIRRFISLLLVLALALAISSSAFAAEEEEEEKKGFTANLSSDGTLNFSAIRTQLRNTVSGEANYITGLSVDPAQGTLFQGYISEANPGAGVATSQIFYFSTTGYDSIDNITFVPKSTYTGNAEISYNVVSSEGKNSSGTITVKVEQQESSVSYSSNGDPIRFQAEDFSAWCLSQTGRSIRSLTFTLPSARYGTLYYNYVDGNIYDGLVDAGTQYFRAGLPSIDNITLIPAEDFNGTFYITFAGLDTAGSTVRGRVRISISGGAPSTGSDLTYSMTAGQSLTFRAADFANACYRETGSELNYVRFSSLPSYRQGTLYRSPGTTAVKTSESYGYDSGLYLIEDVRFVADTGYDGTVSIPFAAYSKSGTSFSGTIIIEVIGNESVNFTYTVKAGQRVYIGAAGAADIDAVCYTETGYPLSYVTFTAPLPASPYGQLYHNTSRPVRTDDKYYYTAGGTYLLENVNFLASDSYEGAFSIPFAAYSSRGTSFNGALRMQVTDAGSSLIIYTVRAGQRIKLNADHFANVCSQKTGYPLNYVRFTSLPTASKGVGVFYENDTANVTSSTNYYRNRSSTGTTQHLLENISFVADADYSGTFSVDFTCYSSGGGNYTGTLYIAVTSASASQTSLITYYSTGPAARFSASDFSSATSRSLSDTLVGIRFTAPDTSAGHMYYVYTSPASYTAFVPGQSYSSSQLSQIYFLPRAGYSGTVSISYTATDNSGNTATGTVQVVVTPPLVSSYFTDMGYSSWAVPAVDFLRAYHVVNGVSATRFAPSSDMIRGDFILMLSRAYGFPSAGTGSFTDVPQNSYYAAAIASARMMGIAEGDASGRFYPSNPISRQDAAVMLYRCMKQNGQTLTGTESVLFGFSDSGSIAPYAIEAMAALVRFGVFQGDDNGLLRPTDSLTRAEMASILYKAVTY